MPNIYSPQFDESREHDGFTCLRARIGRQAGSERVGASLWELPPGEAAYPYHYHLAEEELVVVLEGRPGAHQIVNRSDQVVRFLAMSNQQPDVVIRPDSGTIGAFERRPQGGGLYKHFRLSDAIDYLEGESR
jgi:uncharacterized cupin superfamily protein